MIKRISIFLFIAITAFIVSLKNCYAQAESTTVFDTFKSTYAGFTIEYPFNWVVSDMGKIVMFRSPARDSKDRVRENLVIVAEDITQDDVTLEKYMDALKKRLKFTLANFKLVSSEDTTIDNKPASKIIYTSGGFGRIRLEFLHIAVFYKNRAYNLTFTGAINEFNNYVKNIIEPMISTFSILTPRHGKNIPPQEGGE